MRKWFFAALLGVLTLAARAQEPYPQLGAKLDEYFTALAGENVSVQNAECDFLIESCKDSLVRQYVALKIYDHYLRSHIMGDDAVAVHVADKWFLSGAVAMASEEDLRSARLFAEFNRSSLIGMPAPALSLFAPDGSSVQVPAADGKYSVLFFFDQSCVSCRLEKNRLQEFATSGEYPLNLYAVFVGTDAQAWEKARAGFDGAIHLWDPSLDSDWQRKYGVLSTPGMFLISPEGTILGRGLDTPALRILLNQVFSSGKYVYGESGQMERYKQLFSVYGDTLSVTHVMGVADYLAESSHL